MVPLIVLVISAVLLRVAGRLGVEPLSSWKSAGRAAASVMFMFTGATHFSPMKHDYAAMIPDPLPKSLHIIHLTGLAEIAGAVGLLIPRTRRIAATALAVQLTTMFPANVSAARKGIPFRGQAPTPLWLRGPAQLVYVGALWWTSIHRSSGQRRRRPTVTPRTAGCGLRSRA